jgi:hypothetical protein
MLQRVTEGKIEGMGRRGRKRKQLPDELKEVRRYWKLKKVAQHRFLWSTCFRRRYKHVEDGLGKGSSTRGPPAVFKK